LQTSAPDGQWQEIKADTTLDVPLLDFSGQAKVEAEREVAALIEREVSNVFDLITGPLVRVRILRVSADHHVVLWTAPPYRLRRLVWRIGGQRTGGNLFRYQAEDGTGARGKLYLSSNMH